MNDNLPPLPEPEGQIDNERGYSLRQYTAAQMKAYARTAIERQIVPDLNRLTPFVSGLGKAILQELIEDNDAAAKLRSLEAANTELLEALRQLLHDDSEQYAWAMLEKHGGAA